MNFCKKKKKKKKNNGFKELGILFDSGVGLWFQIINF